MAVGCACIWLTSAEMKRCGMSLLQIHCFSCLICSFIVSYEFLLQTFACNQVSCTNLSSLNDGCYLKIMAFVFFPANTCIDLLLKKLEKSKLLYQPVDAQRLCCLPGRCGLPTGFSRQHCGVAKLPQVMVCWPLRHESVAWTAACFSLSVFVWLNLYLSMHLSSFVSSSDLNPQETLLHFSARRGLCRVTRFLLQQPGARQALQLANREGHTPSAIAASRGHKDLHELLTK